MTNFRKTSKVLLVIGLAFGLSFGPATVAVAHGHSIKHVAAIQTVKPFVFEKTFVAKMDRKIPDIITPPPVVQIVQIPAPPVPNKLIMPVRKAPIAQKPAQTAAPILSGNFPSVATWEKIARCESGNRWNINTGNGYYGGLQENMAFWRGNGGLAYAARPDLATETQQIAVADNAYRTRGFQPWQCGWAAYR